MKDKQEKTVSRWWNLHKYSKWVSTKDGTTKGSNRPVTIQERVCSVCGKLEMRSVIG